VQILNAPFTEEQIGYMDKRFERKIREELKLIFDTGCMNTERTYPEPKPVKPQTEQRPTQPPTVQQPIMPVQWLDMEPTAKGPWQKTTDFTPEIQEIIEKIQAKDKPQFIDGALYWVLEDRETGVVTAVGRRVK
jgi:hypothetical protein